MQVLTDITETKKFIANMMQSFVDLDYWKGWSALFINATPEFDWIKQAKVTALLRSQLPNGTGTILWPEGSVLIVFQEKGDFDIELFKQSLANSIGVNETKVDLITVDQEVERLSVLLALCLGKSQDMVEEKQQPASYNFLKSMVPNIDDLLKEWNNLESKDEDSCRISPVIMVVDDDPMTLKLVGGALGKHYTVHTAKNSAEAIEKHLQLKPDIIFLDIGLPDCDGLTTLNYMQQYDKECRIVMFSADDYLRTRVKAFTGGAKGFLPKPFNLQGFQKYISQWVAPAKKNK